MSKDQILFKGGYKYQLQAEYSREVSIIPENTVDIGILKLDKGGLLTMGKYYAWDGPSGPAPDTPNFMRASLVHDALYQLMRLEEISKKRWRKTADRELRQICREDGMNRFKAWAAYSALRIFGGRAADPRSKNEPRTAP